MEPMAKSKNVNLSGKSLWKVTPTAARNLDMVLGSVVNLPLTYGQMMPSCLNGQPVNSPKQAIQEKPIRYLPSKPCPIM